MNSKTECPFYLRIWRNLLINIKFFGKCLAVSNKNAYICIVKNIERLRNVAETSGIFFYAREREKQSVTTAWVTGNTPR